MKKVLFKLLEKHFLVKYVVVIALIAVCGVAYRLSGHGVFYNSDDIYYAAGEDTADSTESMTDAISAHGGESGKESAAGECYAYVCGSVISPGVYQCRTGTRLYELIQMAGGFCEEADKDYLNLVSVVFDGQKIYVPKKGEAVSDSAGVNGYADKKVNINTAAKQELMQLPGIGEVRADDIIRYRSANGAFQCIEDIMKVGGIKNAAYEKIKDLICI